MREIEENGETIKKRTNKIDVFFIVYFFKIKDRKNDFILTCFLTVIRRPLTRVGRSDSIESFSMFESL